MAANYFDTLAQLYKIPMNGYVGGKPAVDPEEEQNIVSDQPSAHLAPDAEDDSMDEVVVTGSRPVDQPTVPEVNTAPVEDAFKRAGEMLQVKPKSTSEKFADAAYVLGGAMKGDTAKAKGEIDARDAKVATKLKEQTTLAKDLQAIEESGYQLDGLRRENANAKAYDLAVKDANSTTTKIARAAAMDLVKNSLMGDAVKDQYMRMIPNMTAEQIMRDKVMEAIGVSDKLSRENIEVSLKLKDEGRKEAKESRDASMHPLDMKSKQTDIDYKNAQIDNMGKEKSSKLAENTLKNAQDRQRIIDQGTDAKALISALMGHKGRTGSTGVKDASHLFGVLDTPFSGTAEADFIAKLDQLRGKAFLEAYQSLKGGGAIANKEGEKAENAIAALSTNQSDEEFKQSLQDLYEVIDRVMKRAETGTVVVNSIEEANALPKGTRFELDGRTGVIE